jgi:hypothetical protein
MIEGTTPMLTPVLTPVFARANGGGTHPPYNPPGTLARPPGRLRLGRRVNILTSHCEVHRG